MCAGTNFEGRGVLICSVCCIRDKNTAPMADFKLLTVKPVACQVSGNVTISSYTLLALAALKTAHVLQTAILLTFSWSKQVR